MIELLITLVMIYVVYKIVMVVIFSVMYTVCKVMDGKSSEAVVKAPTIQREAFVWCKNDVVVIIGAVVFTVVVCGSKMIYGW